MGIRIPDIQIPVTFEYRMFSKFGIQMVDHLKTGPVFEWSISLERSIETCFFMRSHHLLIEQKLCHRNLMQEMETRRNVNSPKLTEIFKN